MPFAPDTPICGPLQMDISFYLKIPKSTSKAKRKQMLNGKIKHIKKPDVDNLVRPIFNALAKIVYNDDSQLCNVNISKYYSDNPRIVVKISDLEDSINVEKLNL